MGLNLSLDINTRRIGWVEVVRTDPLDEAGPDTVCTYRVVAHKRDSRTQVNVGLIEHRYGDGAWELARKALDKIKEARESERTDRQDHPGMADRPDPPPGRRPR